MARKHLIQEEIKDGQNTLSVKKTYSTRVQGENYYITFIGYMQNILEIKTHSDSRVLAKLCALAEYNTGMVRLTTEVRREALVALKMSNPNFAKSLKNLKELKLVSGKGSDLQIDPRVFWKGELATRRDRMKELNIIVTMSEVESEDFPKE